MKKGQFNVIFQKNILKTFKTNFPGWGFLFPCTAFNDEKNGICPLSVSLLYVENLTKESQKKLIKRYNIYDIMDRVIHFHIPYFNIIVYYSILDIV